MLCGIAARLNIATSHGLASIPALGKLHKTRVDTKNDPPEGRAVNCDMLPVARGACLRWLVRTCAQIGGIRVVEDVVRIGDDFAIVGEAFALFGGQTLGIAQVLVKQPVE